MAKCMVWLFVVCLCHGYSCYGHYEWNQAKEYKLSDIEGKIIGGVEVPISMYPYILPNWDDGMVISAWGPSSAPKLLFPLRTVSLLCMTMENPTFRSTLTLDPIEALKVPDIICRIVQHEKFGKQNSPSHYYAYAYDIALLLLEQKITFNNVVKIIPIAPNWKWRNEKYTFTVAGFGSKSDMGIGSNELKATWMRYVNSELCNRTKTDLNYQILVPDNMFCMIGERWTSDCFGDSGSGIAWRGYLVGLVATGRTTFCGSDMIPSMYTDVMTFRGWVEHHVRELESAAYRTCNNNNILKDLNIDLNCELSK